MVSRRALISVSDKTGVAAFAEGLSRLGFEIISTGGTARTIRDEGIPVTDVSSVTGAPEMMDGRVKTLHPKIHAALLALRDNPAHMRELETQGIEPIDIVAVNLYPFEESIKGGSLEDAIENIDIGGPALVRAAAKNFKHVAVIVDPDDYAPVLDELENGDISEDTKKKLAVKAFRRIADYDCAIDRYLSDELAGEDILRLLFVKGKALRYGENWHQTAKFYIQPGITEPSLANAVQLHGKEMSFNNYVDADSALQVVRELHSENAVAVVKHTNPCGLATGDTLRDALEAAWAGDPVSAFGSILCFGSAPDMGTVQFLQGKFVEVILAPGFEPEALEFLKNKSRELRILQLPGDGGTQVGEVYKYIIGGMLVQSRDTESHAKWESVTRLRIPAEKSGLAKFAWSACKCVKSNAVVIAQEYRKNCYSILGMGAGQPNRIDSLKKAVAKAHENLEITYEREKPDVSMQDFIREKMSRCVLASDAFFPFDDNIVHAAESDIRYIVSTGGSIRDKEVIAAADRLGVAMVFTGTRHFLH